MNSSGVSMLLDIAIRQPSRNAEMLLDIQVWKLTQSSRKAGNKNFRTISTQTVFKDLRLDRTSKGWGKKGV